MPSPPEKRGRNAHATGEKIRYKETGLKYQRNMKMKE
jgi:hypothetical protein